VPESGRVTEFAIGVIVNWMLFKTVVLLAVRLNLLRNGVRPGVDPLILIVVSPASFETANGTTRMTRPTAMVMDAKRFFIGYVFEKTGSIIEKETVVCPAKNFEKAFF
jgi:hypothetical protein